MSSKFNNSNHRFLKLNLAFLSESFWDWANEIWTVRSIERSQNIWFLGTYSDIEIQKISALADTRLHIIIKIINSIDQIDLRTLCCKSTINWGLISEYD